MYNFLESSKSRMQRFEELHAVREPQFGHPWLMVCRSNLFSIKVPSASETVCEAFDFSLKLLGVLSKQLV